MIVPDTAMNKNPVPFPAKNGKGKKFFLLNRFLSGSIAKKGTVVSIIIMNNSCHSLNTPETKLGKMFVLSSYRSIIIVVVIPIANPIRKSLRLESMKVFALTKYAFETWVSIQAKFSRSNRFYVKILSYLIKWLV